MKNKKKIFVDAAQIECVQHAQDSEINPIELETRCKKKQTKIINIQVISIILTKLWYKNLLKINFINVLINSWIYKRKHV